MLLFSNRIHKQNKTVGAEGGTRTPTGIHPLDPEYNLMVRKPTPGRGVYFKKIDGLWDLGNRNKSSEIK